MISINEDYKYKGAKALVALHEIHIRDFYKTWQQAKLVGVTLPKTDDPYYKSFDTLLYHVLRSARGYMVWMCKQLNLPDPQIDEAPLPEIVVENSEKYLNYLLEKWDTPLRNVPPEQFEDKVYKSNWGVEYCIDAMLEHAVMHPIRHEFQLKNLIAEQSK
jgi:hypothetical protein